MGNLYPVWPGWETVRIIGRGGYGAVYEIARCDCNGEIERAAMKVISIPQNPGVIETMYSEGYDTESITRTLEKYSNDIVSEYSLMRKLNGTANVVSCDDYRKVRHADGFGWDIFIRMELLTPLTKALPEHVSEETVVKIALDLTSALELCSRFSIVHRDIKPQNIFVSDLGDYKLGDFGIAKTMERTMTGTMIGTYNYMAPEVFSSRPYGSTADIYSLGLVLYWLLNERRLPFLPLPPAALSAEEDEQARIRRLHGERIPAPKNGSAPLRRIVLKACEFKPENRYQSAAEMHKDLLHFRIDVPPKPIPWPIKNSRAIIAAAGVTAIVALVVLIKACTALAPDSKDSSDPVRTASPSPIQTPLQASSPTPVFTAAPTAVPTTVPTPSPTPVSTPVRSSKYDFLSILPEEPSSEYGKALRSSLESGRDELTDAQKTKIVGNTYNDRKAPSGKYRDGFSGWTTKAYENSSGHKISFYSADNVIYFAIVYDSSDVPLVKLHYWGDQIVGYRDYRSDKELRYTDGYDYDAICDEFDVVFDIGMGTSD